MRTRMIAVCLSFVLMLGVVGTALASPMYTSTIPFFSGGLDLEIGTVYDDPSILIVLFGPQEEIEEVLKPTIANFADFSLHPEVDLHFEYDPGAESPILLLPEYFMQTAIVDESFDFSDANELDFQGLNPGEYLALNPVDILVIKTLNLDVWRLDITSYNGFEPLEVTVSTVPEASTALLLGMGLLVLLGVVKRKKSKKQIIPLVVSILIIACASSASAWPTIPDDNYHPLPCDYSEQLPSYNIGSIAPQAISYGEKIDFRFHSDELGPEAVLSIEEIETPQGNKAYFYPSCRRFTYYPSQYPQPFSIRFRAATGEKTVSQTVQFTPIVDFLDDFPHYDIRSLAHQTLWYGEWLKFRLYSEELGPETNLSMEIIGSSSGKIEIQSSYHGVFYYAPSGVDTESFSVAFTLSDGANTITRTIKITPFPAFLKELSRYNIGELTPQTVWHGEKTEFWLQAEAVGPGASFAMDVIGSPKGTIEFNPSYGHFLYEPGTEDKEPFSVTFTATDGDKTASQTIQVTPMPKLTQEYQEFGEPVHSLPDAEDKAYLIRNDVLSVAKENFNYQNHKTRSISITGKTVVFEQGHANSLYDNYHANPDIKAMNIYGETVIIRSPLHLPQTNVTIYARELRFEGDGLIKTTPISLTTPAERLQNGAHGLKAGDIAVYVSSLNGIYRASDPPIRFILNGGDGQPAGIGKAGDIPQNMMQPWCGFHGNCWFTGSCGSGLIVYMEGLTNYGTKEWPSHGEDATSGGKPGNGGTGGNLITNYNYLLTNGNVSSHGGAAGTKALTVIGSSGIRHAGEFYDGPVYWTKRLAHSSVGPLEQTNEELECRYLKRGKDAEGPEADILVGAQGQLSDTAPYYSWLHPNIMRIVLAYAKDAYLNGHRDETSEIVAYYLKRLAGNLRYWEEMPETWRLELTQMHTELQTLQHRLASGLDYFGNPSGWVPMLSFEVNKLAFEQEIDRAIRIMYLAYWVEHIAKSLEEKVEALKTARQQARGEVEAFQDEYADTMTLIPALEAEAVEISIRKDQLQEDLKQKEQDLLKEAQRIVKKRHEVPWWRKALRFIGGIASTIPYYGINYAGAALTTIAEFDSDTSWEDVFTGVTDIASKDFGDQKKLATEIENIPEKFSFSTVKNYVKNVAEAAKPVAEQLQKDLEILEEAKVPKNEVEAELKKLKAENPDFKDLVDGVAELLAQKEVFARQLTSATQSLSDFSDKIATNLLAIDSMNRDISERNAVQDHRAMLYLNEMERRAKDRLLKYHYYMAKAYEYRLLKPYTGRLDIQNLFTKFQKIVDAGSEHLLSSEDFDALTAVYEEQLSTVADEIFKEYNSGSIERSFPIRFNLQPKQIERLNAGESVTINLKEMGLFQFREENIRIANIAVDRLEAHPEGGEYTPLGLGLLKLSLEHSGLSKLSKSGNVYQFQHYADTIQNPLVWGVIYDGIDKEIDPIMPSAGSESLLYSLLSRAGISTTTDNLLLYSRPAAWADITISRELNTSNGIDIVLDELRLEVTCDYTDKPSHLVTLHVQASDEELMPLFIIGQADVQGLGDGRGSFYRTYQRNSPVTIKAPARYGTLKFTGWTDRYGNSISTDQTLLLSLSSDREIRAEYAQDTGQTDIVIKQNGTEILPGELYNFGFQNIGSSNTATFTIENQRDTAFTVHSIDLASAEYSFSSALSFPMTIEANGSATFDVTYSPATSGMHIADISIPDPIPGGSPYSFELVGGEIFVTAKRGSGLGTVKAGDLSCEPDCEERTISCGPDCTEMVFPSTMNGVAVGLKAIPEDGHRFVRWEAPDGTPLSGTVQAEAGSSAVAIFEKL